MLELQLERLRKPTLQLPRKINARTNENKTHKNTEYKYFFNTTKTVTYINCWRDQAYFSCGLVSGSNRTGRDSCRTGNCLRTTVKVAKTGRCDRKKHLTRQATQNRNPQENYYITIHYTETHKHTKTQRHKDKTAK